MKIEKLEQIPRSSNIRLVMEDGSKLKVVNTIVGDLGLFPGLELTEERIAEIKKANGLASAKLRAVRILASSGTSEKELKRKLREKGESREDTEKAVRWLEDLQLLDDEAAAKQIVTRESAKGYGAARIRATLYQKGIDRSLWDEALSDLPDPQEPIRKYLRSHLGESADAKQLKKVTDALQRRGFRWEDIKTGLYAMRLSVEED